MVETDWREILSFSQRELNEGDKDKLCESLSWMEADDIELNFSDLKTLFRLAQDILKYKSEQVNSLLGQLDTAQRKQKKRKSKTTIEDSPARSSDSAFEAITHQEEIIKANKDILEQLYADIAELEKRKKTIENEKPALDKDSESSRDPLSEMNAVEQLENELVMKNRHIRKLLLDVKNLQDEKSKIKEHSALLQDKLNEATQVFKGYTKQIQKHNQEHTQLKEALVLANETKAELLLEIDVLQKELAEKEAKMNSSSDEIKIKMQHWKNIAKAKKAALELITQENIKLKENLEQTQMFSVSPKNNNKAENHTKELKEKLSEAVEEMIESSKVIESLKKENKNLNDKLSSMDVKETMSETRNDSDDGKHSTLIGRLKQDIAQLTNSLKETEKITELRETELAEVSNQLQLLQSGEEGLKKLLASLKTTKRQLKLKDERIKTLVQEMNSLNHAIDQLQIQNEALRRKLNLPLEQNISTEGVINRYQEIQRTVVILKKSMMKMENQLVSTELDNRDMKDKLSKLTNSLHFMGVSKDEIDRVLEELHEDKPRHNGGEGIAVMNLEKPTVNENLVPRADMDAIIDENEGLRKGLSEILEFIKNNSTCQTGVLAVQCPSLEAVVNSMEARHSSGWFAPHMATVLELKAAMGGRDALLTALNDARKETFHVMSQLKEETQRAQELAKKLEDVQTNTNENETPLTNETSSDFDFDYGKSWMESKTFVDFNNRHELQYVLNKTNKYCESDLRKTLKYFHRKFEDLFHKMTSIAMKHADEKNEWSIQEEKYKAEIQRVLSSSHTDDEKSVDSPGRIIPDSLETIRKKCTYLEESYTYIRTIHENLKQDYLESKKEAMILTADYEIKMQKLLLSLAKMTDKLRNSVSLEMFWKQNETLNNVTIKYNAFVNNCFYGQLKKTNFQDMLEKNKHDILNGIYNHTIACDNSLNQDKNKSLSNVENTILVNQVERLCSELEDVNNKLEALQEENHNLQQTQQKIMNNSLESSSKEELLFVKDQQQKMQYDNKMLREQCTHFSNQLDIAITELHNLQQKHMSNDIEVNMLRHQILDLQTAGDNKAIIARLSGEILVCHLQSAEYRDKIATTQLSLSKETQKRLEIEEMLQSREKVFHIYSQQYESKFRYLFEIMDIFRQQYQGLLPLISIENYLNQTEEVSRKAKVVEEKLDSIEDLRSNLIIKHNVYEQVINMSKAACFDNEGICPHEIELSVKENMQLLEKKEYMKRIEFLEQFKEEYIRKYSTLENTFILINQCFKNKMGFSLKKVNVDFPSLEVQDIQSDDENSSKSSGTVILPKPLILKTPKSGMDMTQSRKQDTHSLPGSPEQTFKEKNKVHDHVNVFVQTTNLKSSKSIQTDSDSELEKCKSNNEALGIKFVNMGNELNNVVAKLNIKTEEIAKLSKVKSTLESKTENLKITIRDKENDIEDLQNMLTDIRNELEIHKNDLKNEKRKQKNARDEENNFLLETIKQLEQDKINAINQYKTILNKERDEYLNSAKEFNNKIIELKTELENRTSVTTNGNSEKDLVNKDTVKILELQDHCFRLESQLDGSKSELQSYKSEIERWKELASERLTKMEQLSNQLQERYSQEVDSYKAENQHWLTQLNETQKEHMDLRSRLAEQKAHFLKQLTEKDSQIEQLRNVVHNLKSQIVSMHTMMSATDPSFDLSAIVEVEDSDAADSDRLEIRFNSTPELREDPVGLPSSSTAIWNEPLLERLRREKQLTAKQNGLLRRQIRALAGRERRARLEAQNLRTQVFRVNTSTRGVAESSSLQLKVAALQAQLASARRDSHAGVALWDKWKRAQQNSERWQAKYEEQCQEVKKLEAALALAKSAVARLEKEKRTLLSRLQDARTSPYEKRDAERPESDRPERERPLRGVPAADLAARVEAQQRRIAALEIAEKGNEPLVSEYERALAEIGLLKGQVLKLESALLESQLKASFSKTADLTPELDYWKSYSDMLKEENLQLLARVSAAGAAGASAGAVGAAAGAQRVAELEKTVLTLRGLVSKLQAEQKCSPKRVAMDPKDDEKTKLSVQLSSSRTEVGNLRRALAGKEQLLQRSRELLRTAADREDELLAENDYLRRQIRESRAQNGSLSA